MRFLPLFTAGCIVALWSLGPVPAEEPADRETELFAADPASGALTLDGWEFYSEDPDAELKDVWTVEGNVIVCKGTPKGYIATRDKYEDFVLRLEWRWPPGGEPGNGGVLLRTTGPDKLWPKSLEAQLNHPHAGDFWGLDGFTLSGPAERTETLEHPKFGKLIHVTKARSAEKPPGEWNRCEITARGDTVTLSINGKQVNRATGCERPPGQIVLTAEGDEIHFRNVRITVSANNGG
jgi:hypothetical protein